jgi:chromosome segregation ATPase
MKSIVTILRVKQREIDALKRTQATMENHREMMHQALEQLSNALVSELKTAQAMPEMAQFFGDFSAHIKRRQEDIHVQLRKLEFEMNKLAEQIRERFGEMKKFELALKAFEKREADKARTREQQEMDEIAIRGYIRKHAP